MGEEGNFMVIMVTRFLQYQISNYYVVYLQWLCAWVCSITQSFSCAQFFGNTRTSVCQALLSMEFSRQEYWWRTCHFLLQGKLPDPGIKPASPALAGGFFTTVPSGKPQQNRKKSLTIHLVIQKEVKLCHQGKLFWLKWNGQSLYRDPYRSLNLPKEACVCAQSLSRV